MRCDECGAYAMLEIGSESFCYDHAPIERRAPRVEKTEAQERKETPIYSGFIKYFPRAMEEVARISYVGNEQHNPGQPLHWDRSKSQDEPDAMVRHLLDHARGEVFDTDGCRHLAKVAWRAMANLEKELEKDCGGAVAADERVSNLEQWKRDVL